MSASGIAVLALRGPPVEERRSAGRRCARSCLGRRRCRSARHGGRSARQGGRAKRPSAKWLTAVGVLEAEVGRAANEKAAAPTARRLIKSTTWTRDTVIRTRPGPSGTSRYLSGCDRRVGSTERLLCAARLWPAASGLCRRATPHMLQHSCRPRAARKELQGRTR